MNKKFEKYFRNVKAVIFDFDGTLIDSKNIWAEVDRRFFEKRNLVMPDDYSENIGHIGLKNAAIYTKREFNLSESVEEIYQEWLDDVEEEYRSNVPLKEGVKEYLDYLKDNHYPFAIATANGRECIDPCLLRAGVLDYFDYIQIADNTKGKNHPDIYLDLAKKLGYKPEEIIVFEDLCTPIRIAKSVGFITCGIDDGNDAEFAKVKATADFTIKSFKEIL